MALQTAEQTLKPAPAPGADESSFADHFDSFSESPASTPEPVAGGDAPTDSDTTSPPAAVAGGQQSPAAPITGEQPAAPAAAPASTTDTPAPAAPGDAPVLDWNAVPEEFRKAYANTETRAKTLDQTLKSTQGRMKRLNEQVRASTQPSTARDAAADGQTTTGKPATSERLKKVAEDIPEVAPLAEGVTDLDTRLARLEGRSAVDDQSRLEQVRLDREDELEEIHPDWKGYLTANAKEFKAWLPKQAPSLQAIVHRNNQWIEDVADASLFLGQFKAHMNGTTLVEPPSQPASSAAPSNMTARRTRQLDGSATVTTRGQGHASGPADDFNSAFDYFAEDDKRKASRH